MICAEPQAMVHPMAPCPQLSHMFECRQAPGNGKPSRVMGRRPTHWDRRKPSISGYTCAANACRAVQVRGNPDAREAREPDSVVEDSPGNLVRDRPHRPATLGLHPVGHRVTSDWAGRPGHEFAGFHASGHNGAVRRVSRGAFRERRKGPFVQRRLALFRARTTGLVTLRAMPTLASRRRLISALRFAATRTSIEACLDRLSASPCVSNPKTRQPHRPRVHHREQTTRQRERGDHLRK